MFMELVRVFLVFNLVSFCFSFLWVNICSSPLEPGEVLGGNIILRQLLGIRKLEICPVSYCCFYFFCLNERTGILLKKIKHFIYLFILENVFILLAQNFSIMY